MPCIRHTLLFIHLYIAFISFRFPSSISIVRHSFVIASALWNTRIFFLGISAFIFDAILFLFHVLVCGHDNFPKIKHMPIMTIICNKLSTVPSIDYSEGIAYTLYIP